MENIDIDQVREDLEDILYGRFRQEGFEDGVDFVYDRGPAHAKGTQSFSKPLIEWLLRDKAEICAFIEGAMFDRGYRLRDGIRWSDVFSFW